jgi:hypothetical protein
MVTTPGGYYWLEMKDHSRRDIGTQRFEYLLADRISSIEDLNPEQKNREAPKDLPVDEIRNNYLALG